VFDTTEIKELERLKQLLVAESDLNRHTLRLEVLQLKASAARLEKAFQVGRSVYPFLKIAVALVRCYRSAGSEAVKSFSGKVLSGLTIFRGVRTLWKTFSETKAAKDDDSAE
jgi:hypothetical protein